MNLSRSEIHALRSERAAYAQAVRAIREACALPDVPLAELPGAVEALLCELADRQIRADIAPLELQPGCDEIVVTGLRSAPGLPDGDPDDDEWTPEDTVVPAPGPSCRGCLRLTEIDGRLMCGEARSRVYGAGIHWPGPGCVWAGAGDRVYGGGRG